MKFLLGGAKMSKQENQGFKIGDVVLTTNKLVGKIVKIINDKYYLKCLMKRDLICIDGNDIRQMKINDWRLTEEGNA